MFAKLVSMPKPRYYISYFGKKSLNVNKTKKKKKAKKERKKS